MYKSKKTILFFLILIILITGCTNNKENSSNVKQRVSTNNSQELICKGTNRNNGIETERIVNIKYKDNKLENGIIVINVTLVEDLSEEKNILNDLNMCSDDVMTSLINHGECTTEVDNNQLTSTLLLDKKYFTNNKVSLENIKQDIENNEFFNSKCIIN